MEPVARRLHPAKGYQIVHRCTACGARSVNRAAVDGLEPDDVDVLARLPPE